MNDIEQRFADKWPDWFGPGKVRCGFWLPVGWEDLVWTLCELLSHRKYDMRIDQVKEKFGGLRFYYTCPTGTIDAVSLAEELSTKLCQECGNRGTLGGKGWISTLCDPCRASKP